MMQDFNDLALAGIILGIFAGAAVLIFFWVFFPFMVLSALKKQLETQRNILLGLRGIHSALTPPQICEPQSAESTLEYAAPADPVSAE